MSIDDRSTSVKYSHVATNKRHIGLGTFLKSRWLMVLTFVCGVSVSLSVFFYVYWLSRQRFRCPPWAIECATHSNVAFFIANTALLQGVLTTAYHTGIVAIAYSFSTLTEMAIWPLLRRKACRLVDIDSYLSATKGSFVSAVASLATIPSIGVAVLLFAILISVASQQISGVLVGWALHPANITAVYQTKYQRGGGLGLPFMQYYPGPAPCPGGIENAISFYTIWSASPDAEPLPEIRDYIIDRAQLSLIGNITVQAPQIHRNITCVPHAVKLKKVGDTQRAIVSYEVDTNYSLGKTSETHTGTKKPWPVRIRQQQGLTSWVDKVEVLSSKRSNTTVIFGSFNDHIENSFTNKVNSNTNFTSLACSIEVEIEDGIASIGQTTIPGLTLTSQPAGFISNLTNEIILPLWLGAATTFIGGSVAGLQPTYDKTGSGWPSPRYTNFGSVQSWNNADVWNISDITMFIHNSQSAVAQGSKCTNMTTYPDKTCCFY